MEGRPCLRKGDLVTVLWTAVPVSFVLNKARETHLHRVFLAEMQERVALGGWEVRLLLVVCVLRPRESGFLSLFSMGEVGWGFS